MVLLSFLTVRTSEYILLQDGYDRMTQKANAPDPNWP
jgi:hypothetical protein